MGLFDRFKSNGKLPSGWIEMTQSEQLQEAIEQSFAKPVVLFKHSIRCGISMGAKYSLESEWDLANEDIVFYYLDLITYRPISNAISQELGVLHQSPQIIVVRNGKAIHTNTHHAIGITSLKEGLNKAHT